MPNDPPIGSNAPSAPNLSAPPVGTASAHDIWDNEGGSASCNSERIIHTPGTALPYWAVLTRPSGEPLSCAFATMREAEAFVRSNTPVRGPTLSVLYDRPPQQS